MLPASVSATDDVGMAKRPPDRLSTATWSRYIVRPGIESAFQTATVALAPGREIRTGTARALPMIMWPPAV
jgi:hypothetical protein